MLLQCPCLMWTGRTMPYLLLARQTEQSTSIKLEKTSHWNLFLAIQRMSILWSGILKVSLKICLPYQNHVYVLPYSIIFETVLISATMHKHSTNSKKTAHLRLVLIDAYRQTEYSNSSIFMTTWHMLHLLQKSQYMLDSFGKLNEKLWLVSDFSNPLELPNVLVRSTAWGCLSKYLCASEWTAITFSTSAERIKEILLQDSPTLNPSYFRNSCAVVHVLVCIISESRNDPNPQISTHRYDISVHHCTDVSNRFRASFHKLHSCSVINRIGCSNIKG